MMGMGSKMFVYDVEIRMDISVFNSEAGGAKKYACSSEVFLCSILLTRLGHSWLRSANACPYFLSLFSASIVLSNRGMCS